MKIDNERMIPTLNPYKNEPAGRGSEAGRNSEAAQNGESARRIGSDRVNISISKEDIARLEQSASQPSDERSRKISALKEQISNGTYRVDAEAVAKKIVEKMQESRSASQGEVTPE